MTAKNKTPPAVPTKTPPVAPPTAKEVPALSIVSKREGFRRAGHSFGSKEAIIKVGDLSKEQVAALQAEPLLAVTETTVTE